MKNRILAWLLVMAIGLLTVCPLAVSAAPLNTQEDASLTLFYERDGYAFADVTVAVFRVAEAAADGTFSLVAPFSSYPVNIHDITKQTQWTTVATTLNAYIAAEQIVPDRTVATDAQGTARFAELKTGLYLVQEVTAENAQGRYTFNRFLVYVPTPQADGSYEYHVEAKPKCTRHVPTARYTVTKLWKDDGDRAARPREVTVDIYRDGVLQESQILSADNQWSYTWQVTEETGNWSVAERAVPNGYTVSIRQNGGTFSIINTRSTTPEPPPDTGETFTPLPWILAMALSGMVLVILGIGRKRR